MLLRSLKITLLAATREHSSTTRNPLMANVKCVATLAPANGYLIMASVHLANPIAKSWDFMREGPIRNFPCSTTSRLINKARFVVGTCLIPQIYGGTDRYAVFFFLNFTLAQNRHLAFHERNLINS